MLATSSIGSDINNVDLIALVKVVGSPPLAIIWCVQPLCACVDTCRDEDHWVWLVDLVGGCQFFDIELVAPSLLTRNAGVDIATTNIEEISLVSRFLAATFRADAFDASAINTIRSEACEVDAVLC